MEPQSGRNRRQVDIFNFSFLDILACVIGLLILILSIVVISGGSSSNPTMRKRAAEVEAVESSLAQAKSDAATAASRKLNAQALLATTSTDLGDSTVAKDVVIAQTAQFNSAAQASARLDADIKEKIASLKPKIDLLQNDMTRRNIDRERALTEALENESGDLQNSNAEIALQARTARKEISFYVPRLRETSKKPIFIEVDNGRFWFVESADYDQAPLDTQRGATFTRKANALGTDIRSFVASGNIALPALARYVPAATVLTFLVRPDSFDTVRPLREWAWKNGYGVHWMPMAKDETITLVPASNSWQQ